MPAPFTRPKKASTLLALVAAVMLLSGCSTIKGWFTSADDEPPLKGERISILQLQKELAPNPELEKTPPELPAPWENHLWPQAGGYPTHAMGHLALGAKISKAWKSSVGHGQDDRAPLTAVPVAADGMVFALDSNNTVTALDLKTGSQKWRQSVIPRGEDDAGAVGGGLAYSAGKLYVIGGYKVLSALDGATGKLAWKVNIPAVGRAAPTVMGDKVYVITIDNRLFVYNANDGTLLWKYSGISETTDLLGSAAVAADDNLAVLPLSSGDIFGLAPSDGHVLWQDNLAAVHKAGPLSSISDIRALPVIDQNVIYAVSYSGRMVAIDETTGQRIWQREIGSAETPCAAGDTVFVVTAEQQITALSRASGEIHWVTELPRHLDPKDIESLSIVWSGPVLAGGRLFIVSSGGEMREMDPATGKMLTSEKLSAGASLPPIVVDDTLLVLTNDGDITAYR